MSNETDDVRLNAFWPLLFLGASLLIFFVWQLVLASQVLGSTKRMSVQYEDVVARSQQAEEQLKAIMFDLLALSERDATARLLVKKYNVAFTPPSDAGGAKTSLNLGEGAVAPAGELAPAVTNVPDAEPVAVQP